jgi:ubiquinone/menaquinone biosynthesis C-methylase UbiE
MTYRDWEAKDRSTNAEIVVRAFLDANPYLQESQFRAFAGQRVLEIGCGSGAASMLFAQGGANVTAIDLNEHAIAMAKIHSESLQVTAICMDAEAMDFPDGSFDHVFSWGVLHHTSDPKRAFAELARVLRPGGTALVMVYNRQSLRYWFKGLYVLILKAGLLRGETMASVQRFHTDGYFHRHYSPRELRAALVPLIVTETYITHMSKQMVPWIPRLCDNLLKRWFGWLLVVRLIKGMRVS